MRNTNSISRHSLRWLVFGSGAYLSVRLAASILTALRSSLIRNWNNICLAVLFWLLVCSANAGAVSSIVMTPATANGDVYIISAADIKDASGIELSFSYDTATITNPIVTPGPFAVDSNVIMEANTKTPGSIHLYFAIGGEFKGDGQLARITFTKTGKLPGRVYDLKSDVFSASSEQVAAQPIIASATTPAADEEEPAEAGVNTASSRSSSSGGGMSNIFNQAQQQKASSNPLSGDEMMDIYNQAKQQQQSGGYQSTVTVSGSSPLQPGVGREEPKRDEYRSPERTGGISQETVPAGKLPAAAASSAQSDTVKSPAVKNANEAIALLKAVEMPVQRFRTFKGVRSVKNLAALFDTAAARKTGVLHIPETVVSDGKELVTIRIEFAVSGLVPNFSLRGANLKSLRPVSDKVWELDALPQKGKFDVHLTVLLGSELVDIPLAVIPPLDPAVIKDTQELSENGVGALLAKAEQKIGKPAYDLNMDGRQDYIDDYILVAHYVLKSKKTVKPSIN